MARGFSMAVAVFGAWVLSGSSVYAQQGTGELRGRILDAQSAVLPGVTVVAKNEATGQFREVVSGADGSFFMSALTPGVYELSAQLSGFKRYQRTGVRVEVGKTFAIDVQLEVGGIEQAITVTGESPLVDTTSKQIGGHVTSQELNDIPSINRNFTTYLGTLPGVTAIISTDSFGADSIRVNGQGTQNVNYTLDGAGNNDTFNGGNGGAQARTPVEAVQEFQLLTSQFDAEFGASSGGVVNAVSKQGTNTFHGTVFFFNANADMTARTTSPRSRTWPKPRRKQLQWGGNVGGPIIKNKLHFFANLERIDQNRGITINIPARPDLNFTDFTHDNVWNWMVRMDHQINASNTWAVRWLRETSPQSNQFPGVTNWTKSRAEKETDTDWTIVGTLNSVIRNTKVNTLEALVHQRERVLRQPGVLRHRRPGARSGRSSPSRRTRTASAPAPTGAWIPPISWTRRSRGSCPARRASTTSSSAPTSCTRRSTSSTSASSTARSPSRRPTWTSTPRTRAPIRTASRFACRRRPTSSSTGRSSASSRRTNGRSTTA